MLRIRNRLCGERPRGVHGFPQDAIETQVCCEPVQEEVTVEERDEITDGYFDAIVAREIIQPVERTIIQPVERQILQGSMEDVTEPIQYETERLSVIVEEDAVPQLIENFIPQETVETREEVTETFYDAIAQRDIYQPIVRTIVQPVEIRRVRPQVETVTAPVRYETARGQQIIINIGTSGCACGNYLKAEMKAMHRLCFGKAKLAPAHLAGAFLFARQIKHRAFNDV